MIFTIIAKLAMLTILMPMSYFERICNSHMTYESTFRTKIYLFLITPFFFFFQFINLDIFV